VIDYDDLTGMIAEFVPVDVIRNVIDLIAAQKLDEAKAIMGEYSFGQSALFQKLEAAAHERYEKLFTGLPCKTYLIWGNVDFPDILKEHLLDHTVLVENSVLKIDGRQCGFVSGSPHMQYSFGMPGEFTREEYRKRLYALGPVDHLFVHPPPAIADLTYDTLADRDEEGSVDLLAFIDAHNPKTVHFGHVHAPRLQQMTHNKTTELINVGYFRKTQKLFEL
jgi:Icc-related predicted phosphoesterase